ncbi:hypothetical protein ACLOJK_027251 [Asimina triloba]
MAAKPITAGDSSICPTSPPPQIPADNGNHEQTPVRLRPPFPPSSRSPSQIRWPRTISRPIHRPSSPGPFSCSNGQSFSGVDPSEGSEQI